MTSQPPSPPAKSHVHVLLLGLILAVAAYIQFTVVTRTVVDTPLRADAGEYFNYAYNLEHHGVYSLARLWDKFPAPPDPPPDKYRSPGYPLFLLAAGTPEPVESYGHRVVLLQAALGVLSVGLAYLIAASAMARRWALGLALLVATTPQLATINTYLLTEGLFTFLLLAATLTLIRAARGRRAAWYVASGALWGLATLVRPTTLLLPPLLLALAWLIPSMRNLRRPALAGFAAFALVLAPWIVRNLSVPSEPGMNMMVNTIAHGSYPGFMYEMRPGTFGYPYRADPRIKEITRDLPSLIRDIAHRAARQPFQYSVWYLVGKPFYFLSLRDVQSADIMIYPTLRSPYYEDVRFAAMRIASRWLHWPLVLAALAVLVLMAFRRASLDLGRTPGAASAAGLTALVVVYAIGFHMLAAPFPRYAIPFRPLIFILACVGLHALWKHWRARPK